MPPPAPPPPTASASANLCAGAAAAASGAAALLPPLALPLLPLPLLLVQPLLVLDHSQRVVLVGAVGPRRAVAAQERLADRRVGRHVDVEVGAVGRGAETLRAGGRGR